MKLFYLNSFWPNGNIQTSVLKSEDGKWIKWRAWDSGGKELNGPIYRQEMEIILEQDEEYRSKNPASII